MKIAIVFLSLFIIFILSIVYVKISAPVNLKEPEIREKITNKPKIKELNATIYDFPARIAYMKIDIKNYRYITLYKAEIDVNDKFTLFNVKELLKINKIPFSLKEDKRGIKIYILFRNLQEAKRIINLFKEYNFKIKLQKIKQRI